LTAIDGTKTVEGVEFKIKTPLFELYSLSDIINKDEEIYFSFNSPINLDKFKSLFSISDYNNSELDIKYFVDQDENSSENIVSVYPKS
jgi:hypothetical protein